MTLTHLNFLLFIGLILNRLPSDSKENLWAQSLFSLLEQKAKKGISKAEMFAQMSRNNLEIREYLMVIVEQEKEGDRMSDLAYAFLDGVKKWIEAVEEEKKEGEISKQNSEVNEGKSLFIIKF